MSIAANKVMIRGFVSRRHGCSARGHNDANVLALGALVVSLPHAFELVGIFLDAAYEAGRHEPRLTKIGQLEGS
jgi:ribose 5-phosphate isomerase B